MVCVNCSTNNSEGRKYCSECGSNIVIHCKKCNFANYISDKFCGGCGQSLSALNIQQNKCESSEKSMESFHSTYRPIGGYSQIDIRELMEDDHERGNKAKQKDVNPNEGMTQSMLDSIFESDESHK